MTCTCRTVVSNYWPDNSYGTFFFNLCSSLRDKKIVVILDTDLQQLKFTRWKIILFQNWKYFLEKKKKNSNSKHLLLLKLLLVPTCNKQRIHFIHSLSHFFPLEEQVSLIGIKINVLCKKIKGKPLFSVFQVEPKINFKSIHFTSGKILELKWYVLGSHADS